MSTEAGKFLKQGQEAFFSESPDLASAKKCFEKVVALAPNWAEGYHWLAICYERMNLSGEAIKSYQKATDCDSNDSRPRIALGRLLSTLGHQDKAIAELRRGIALNPHYGEADARLFLAEAYERSGDMRHAIEQWALVAKMEGSYPSYDEPMKQAQEKLKEHERK